jgi:hypothetical protein
MESILGDALQSIPKDELAKLLMQAISNRSSEGVDSSRSDSSSVPPTPTSSVVYNNNSDNKSSSSSHSGGGSSSILSPTAAMPDIDPVELNQEVELLGPLPPNCVRVQTYSISTASTVTKKAHELMYKNFYDWAVNKQQTDGYDIYVCFLTNSFNLSSIYLFFEFVVEYQECTQS